MYDHTLIMRLLLVRGRGAVGEVHSLVVQLNVLAAAAARLAIVSGRRGWGDPGDAITFCHLNFGDVGGDKLLIVLRLLFPVRGGGGEG